jgi:hypothetical protein
VAEKLAREASATTSAFDAGGAAGALLIVAAGWQAVSIDAAERSGAATVEVELALRGCRRRIFDTSSRAADLAERALPIGAQAGAGLVDALGAGSTLGVCSADTTRETALGCATGTATTRYTAKSAGAARVVLAGWLAATDVTELAISAGCVIVTSGAAGRAGVRLGGIAWYWIAAAAGTGVAATLVAVAALCLIVALVTRRDQTHCEK